MREPLVLTVEQAAEALQIGRTCAYELARSGELPTVRLGRSLRVPRHQLEALIGLENGDGPAETGPSATSLPKEKDLDGNGITTPR